MTHHDVEADTAGRPPTARLTRVLLRTLVCLLVAAVLGAPLALSWALTHTEVVSQVGTSPTTFALSPGDTSEVRLGIAGTVFVPESRSGVGIVATVTGPGDPGTGDGDLADYVRPEMVKLYAGLFHHPEEAVEEVVDLVEEEFLRQLVTAECVLTLAGGALLLALSYLLPAPRGPGRGRTVLRVGTAAVLLVTASGALAWVQVQVQAREPGAATAGRYDLPVLDGTLAEGSTTNSPVLRALLGGAVAKATTLVERQGAAVAAYRSSAEESLAGQMEAMQGPGDGELAVLVQSDMHCNLAMIALQSQVVSQLHEQHGDDAVALMAIAGDLTTNGTAAEGTCIEDEAAIAGDIPIAAITGNHETELSAEQMAGAGMTVLDGSTEEVGGVRVLGDGDPSRTELFGGSALRGEETQQGQGRRLLDVASGDDPPDVVMVHEGYAAAAFLGVEDMRTFLESPTPLVEPVDDVPASAVLYGHWHRSVEPRVVWNSDGTWTFVMELDTSGGAVATSTIDNFSTPWSPPRQPAAFPVLFLDEDSRLVTGYQLYRFEVDGTVVVEPRVEVGAPPD